MAVLAFDGGPLWGDRWGDSCARPLRHLRDPTHQSIVRELVPGSRNCTVALMKECR